MTILHRVVVTVALLLGCAGVVLGLLGLQRADDANHKLKTTRVQLADVRTQLSAVTGATTSHDDQAASLATLNSQVSALTDEVSAIIKACPDKDVNAYYQRLLGAQSAGTDESGAIALLTTICPNVNQ